MPLDRDTTIINTLFLHSLVTRQLVNGSEEGKFVGQLRESMTSNLENELFEYANFEQRQFLLGIKSHRVSIEERFSVFSRRQHKIKK